MNTMRSMLMRSTALVYYVPVGSIFAQGRLVLTNEMRLYCDLVPA
jgi:hypothetical protein